MSWLEDVALALAFALVVLVLAFTFAFRSVLKPSPRALVVGIAQVQGFTNLIVSLLCSEV